MRYLVLSDIHANLEALEATLAAAGHYDRALVLGDLVGYGADPNAVIDRVRTLSIGALIRGNHDKVGAGLEDADSFNHVARQAIEWTYSNLTEANRSWLAALPQGPMLIDELVEICHGTPFDEDEYVFDELGALRSLRSAQRPLCLYGHTHVPAVFRLAARQAAGGGSARKGGAELVGSLPSPPAAIDLDDQAQYLINCGAVGQPRDGDARAAYGFVDVEARTVTLLRVEYDLAAAQAKIIKAGLPEVLARRLAVGR